MAKRRKNTQLESEGAEFLVLGNLLLIGIPAYKAYTNMTGYDLVATNPDKNTSVRIQVKSRYRTDWDGFIIKNFDSDFVVFVTLNRGYAKKKKTLGSGIKNPEFYVFPTDYVKDISDPKNNWGKIVKSRMVNFEEYLNRWDLIKQKLDNAAPNNRFAGMPAF
jgi:hypothetical protein